MRFAADHDFHIHSTVSSCCHDPAQTPEALLRYAEENGYRKICLTNHFWDETVKSEAEWIDKHYFEPVCSVLPLPQGENTQFLFGAEADMDYNFVFGISPERLQKFDFVTVATTHMHLDGNTVKTKIQTPEEAAELWFERNEALLKKDLPWHKIGIAHLTCGHILKERTPEVVKLLDEKRMYAFFSDCAAKCVGIELNMKTLNMSNEEKEILLHPYHVAKDCGCKFYLGSDSHKQAVLADVKQNFEDVITLLDLKESDKFALCR